MKLEYESQYGSNRKAKKTTKKKKNGHENKKKMPRYVITRKTRNPFAFN